MDLEQKEGENDKKSTIPEGYKLTSVKISIPDWIYCKENGLQFTNMLQVAIFEHRQVSSGALVVNNQEARERTAKMAQRLQKALEFVAKHDLIDELYEEMEK